MIKSNYKVLGVMSGTSLDGIDLAECFFEFSQGRWAFKIGKSLTVPYPEIWVLRLKDAIYFSEGRLHSLNKEYTLYLTEVISKFLKENRIANLDAICSHGHTILHQPDKGITLQIGNLPEIAQMLQQTVICDFRVQDVKMGGQGAPLVPIGDQLLFSNYDYCLNLGGFANCSFSYGLTRHAYDICPVNIVLNPLANNLGFPYDNRGQLAKSGDINQQLLTSLNQLEFYTAAPPKSLGLEWVQQFFSPLLMASEISEEDKLATVTEHIAIQLANQMEPNSTILVTGGGAYNDYLLERLRFHGEMKFEIPSTILLEYKEALIFGLLGVLRLRGETNCLASVTGAHKDHSSGEIYVP